MKAQREGPTVIMIENYMTGLVWTLLRRCPYILEGLRRARFNGHWLDGTSRKCA
jgi:hypothetical protein